jgi:chromosome segregation ATPase
MPEAPRTKKEEHRDQYTVVLEDLRSQFKVFGENLDSVRTKGEATFEAVGVLQEDVASLKEDVAVLKEDMQEVKEELHIIRNELKEKVGRDEFVALENRVKRLEKIAH